MGAALEVEALKLWRATAARVAALAVVLGVPAVTTGFIAAAGAYPDSPMAMKVAPMLVGEGWAAQLGMAGQMLSVGLLLAAGVVVSWSYGREHTDGTFGALFAVAVPRRDVALAKAVLLLAWGTGVCVAAVAVTALAGLAVGHGAPGAEAVEAGGRAVVVGLLTVLLAMPLAFVASALRGYLPGIAALLGIVVVTQVVTVAGAGAWFPYAAPGMWAGLGGTAAAAAVVPAQLLLAVPVGVLGVAATAWWWDRAEVR